MAKYMKTEQGYIDIPNFALAPFKPAGKSYLTFSSSNSFTLKVNNSTKNWDGTLEYFASDKTWTVWDGTTVLSAVYDDVEYSLYLRGTKNTIITGNSMSFKWILNGSNIACIGNIENLLDYPIAASGNHPTMADCCYAYMFYDCTSLTQAPALPATTLAQGCYQYMFTGCSALTQAPALPATTLANSCYHSMFRFCAALTQAPALPATTLANYCYHSMFDHCTSLTQAPALPATKLADHCYHSMFGYCAALTQAPALPATKLADHCYSYMFEYCTALTQAPALPATTLAGHCYQRMFSVCTKLTQAPALPATTLADYCYSYMFDNCYRLKLSSTKTDEYTQEYRIPSSGEGATATNALDGMFIGTGGTLKRNLSINTTYYLSSDNMIVRKTDIATLNGYVGSMIDNAGECIPVPATAKVGQTVVVKAVDANGKPTEWEAADMASGADGKSAYAYAVEGGYTGTEAEFAAKLASEALIVHVAESNGTLSADKTYVDIRDAILDGTPVLVDYGGVKFPLISMGNSLFFGASQCNETSVVTVIIEIASNDEVHDFSAQIAIPTTLPNPNALTFTGAVTGSYDGSAAMTVNIPSAVTDDHINSLIDTKLGVIENGSY